MKAKEQLETSAEYDAMLVKDQKTPAVASRPIAAWCRRFRIRIGGAAGVSASNKSRHARAFRHLRFRCGEERHGWPGHLARRCTSRCCPAMTSSFALAASALPINAMPMQCHDDARPDPKAHGVPPAAPRHHRSSPGRRASGPALAGRLAYRCILAALGLALSACWSRPCRLGLARLSFGSTAAGRSTYFGASQLPRFSMKPPWQASEQPASHRRPTTAPIAGLSGSGCQRTLNQDEFPACFLSPLRMGGDYAGRAVSRCETGHTSGNTTI